MLLWYKMIRFFIRQLQDSQHTPADSLRTFTGDFPLGNHTAWISLSYREIRVEYRNGVPEIQLGNLETPVYKGDSANNFKIEWIPGDVENIYIEDQNDHTVIRYDDYTSFTID